MQPPPPSHEPPPGTEAHQQTQAAATDANAAAWAKYYADKKAYDEQQAQIAQQWQAYNAQQAAQQKAQQDQIAAQWKAYYAQQNAARAAAPAQYQQPQYQQQYQQQSQSQGGWTTVQPSQQPAQTTPKAYGAYGSYSAAVRPPAPRLNPTPGAQTPTMTRDPRLGKDTSRPGMWVPGQEDRDAMRQAAAQGPQSHPPSLENYVNRCFQSCKTPQDRQLMEQRLKENIQSLSKEQRAARNWGVEPIPSLQPQQQQSRWGMEPKAFNGRLPAPPPPPQGGNSLPTNFFAPSLYGEGGNSQGGKKGKKQQQRKGKKRNVGEMMGGAGLTGEELRARNARQARFDKMSAGPSRYTAVQKVEEIDWDNLDKYVVKGTCMEVEKKYFRLTCAPNPEAVRPEPVLRKALALVKQKWKEEANYQYTIDQLRSLRQDLKVQHIENDLTVDTYETNARISLENGDIRSFKECQTALPDLYKEGNAGSQAEFAAYQIMYTAFSVTTGPSKNLVVTGAPSNRALSKMLQELKKETRQHEAVQHANRVREAVRDNNYVAFFRLHEEAPFMGAYLMDIYMQTMRVKGLRSILRAYRPTIPIDAVRETLVYDEDEEEDEKAFAAFLQEQGVVVKEGSDPPLIDTKASLEAAKRLDKEREEEAKQKRF